MTNVLELPVQKITTLYRQKKLSPVEVMEACLKQVLKYNPALNAFSFLDEKNALRQARVSEKRWQRDAPIGPLDGVPATVKDWFHRKGWPTRYGSLLSSPLRQPETSPPVARLQEQGVLFIGKTTLPEFGHKGATHSPLTGITRNPWDMTKTPGGSSGGAAVAAATSMGLLHFGSDAGGSVRIPASFTGVFGFKPSPGLVPSWPPGLFSTLSAVGAMARNVEDAALMMDVLMLPDARDWHALPYRPLYLYRDLKKPLPKLRIAYAASINGTQATPAVAGVLKKIRPLLDSLGDVDDITLRVPHLIDVFNRHWSAVASYSAAAYNAREKKEMDPRFLHWAGRGDAMALHEYLWAERERMSIGEHFKKILDSYDLLITPTTAMEAFAAGENMPLTEKGTPWEDWTPFTYPANLAKLPAASLPVGMTGNALPVGLQIMGGFLKDALVLQAAWQLEERAEFKSWLSVQG